MLFFSVTHCTKLRPKQPGMLHPLFMQPFSLFCQPASGHMTPTHVAHHLKYITAKKTNISSAHCHRGYLPNIKLNSSWFVRWKFLHPPAFSTTCGYPASSGLWVRGWASHDASLHWLHSTELSLAATELWGLWAAAKKGRQWLFVLGPERAPQLIQASHTCDSYVALLQLLEE